MSSQLFKLSSIPCDHFFRFLKKIFLFKMIVDVIKFLTWNTHSFFCGVGHHSAEEAFSANLRVVAMLKRRKNIHQWKLHSLIFHSTFWHIKFSEKSLKKKDFHFITHPTCAVRTVSETDFEAVLRFWRCGDLSKALKAIFCFFEFLKRIISKKVINSRHEYSLVTSSLIQVSFNGHTMLVLDWNGK